MQSQCANWRLAMPFPTFRGSATQRCTLGNLDLKRLWERKIKVGQTGSITEEGRLEWPPRTSRIQGRKCSKWKGALKRQEHQRQNEKGMSSRTVWLGNAGEVTQGRATKSQAERQNLRWWSCNQKCWKACEQSERATLTAGSDGRFRWRAIPVTELSESPRHQKTWLSF